MNYDLEERTAKFGEDVIDFVRILERSEINRPLISQVIRSSTSVGANYISICRKESNETKHWLRMIARANMPKSDKCKILWKEAHELTLIFSKIVHSTD